MTPEHKLQNEIRNALAGKCLLWRANVGQGWTSSSKPIKASRPMSVELQPGDVVLRQGRPFSTGLPKGFPDTFGMTFDGRFLGPEVKTPTGVPSKEQLACINAINRAGGRAGVVRSVEDALALLEREV